MKVISYSICMVAMLALQGSTRAQDSARPIARELISISVNPGSDYTRPGRAKFVAVLSNYCTEILTALPTNTPNEEAWLDAEAKTSDMEKIGRLVLSAEWSRRELKSVFEGCRENTANILRAHKLSIKDDTVARYEAAQLVSIAIKLNDSNDILKYSSRAGLNPAAWQLDFLGTIREALLVAALRTLEQK